jgi:hypothetical protein
MPGPRLLSLEPLIGPINIERAIWRDDDGPGFPFRTGIKWVIVGGESGPGRRPARVEWVRQIRDECPAHREVTFFLKQWALIDAMADANRISGGQIVEGPITTSHPKVKSAMLSVPLLDGVQYASAPPMFATDVLPVTREEAPGGVHPR